MSWTSYSGEYCNLDCLSVRVLFYYNYIKLHSKDWFLLFWLYHSSSEFNFIFNSFLFSLFYSLPPHSHSNCCTSHISSPSHPVSKCVSLPPPPPNLTSKLPRDSSLFRVIYIIDAWTQTRKSSTICVLGPHISWRMLSLWRSTVWKISGVQIN